MSRHITITGVYRNNKRNTVGVHNTTNTEFTQEHKQHLIDVIDTHIKPKRDEYKALIIEHYLDGKLLDKASGQVHLDTLDIDTIALVNELIELHKFYSERI